MSIQTNRHTDINAVIKAFINIIQNDAPVEIYIHEYVRVHSYGYIHVRIHLYEYEYMHIWKIS